MTINLIDRNLTNDVSQPYYGWLSVYVPTDEGVVERYESEPYTDTAAASSYAESEKEISPYEIMCGSGALDLWDEPEEDIYSFEDGEAV